MCGQAECLEMTSLGHVRSRAMWVSVGPRRGHFTIQQLLVPILKFQTWPADSKCHLVGQKDTEPAVTFEDKFFAKPISKAIAPMALKMIFCDLSNILGDRRRKKLSSKVRKSESHPVES